MTQLQQSEDTDVLEQIAQCPYATNETRRLGPSSYGFIDRKAMYEHLTANALVPSDVQREIDETFVRVARRELVGVADLQNAGLVANLGSIGITQYEFERLSATNAATQSMAIDDLGQEDRVEYDLDAVPVPVTRAGFRLNQRITALGSNRGASVAQVHTDERTFQVVDKLEDSLTNGGDAVIGGNSMPGYTNFSARQTVTLSTAWPSLTNNEDALADVLSMKQALTDNGYDSNYILYIPSNWSTFIEEDFKSNSDRSVRERLMSVDGLTQIKVLPSLADDNALLVQMTPNVVQIAMGQDITSVTWDIHGGLAQRWLILAVMSFALKRADDGTGTLVSGIAHLS